MPAFQHPMSCFPTSVVFFQCSKSLQWVFLLSESLQWVFLLKHVTSVAFLGPRAMLKCSFKVNLKGSEPLSTTCQMNASEDHKVQVSTLAPKINTDHCAKWPRIITAPAPSIRTAVRRSAAAPTSTLLTSTSKCICDATSTIVLQRIKGLVARTKNSNEELFTMLFKCHEQKMLFWSSISFSSPQNTL